MHTEQFRMDRKLIIDQVMNIICSPFSKRTFSCLVCFQPETQTLERLCQVADGANMPNTWRFENATIDKAIFRHFSQSPYLVPLHSDPLRASCQCFLKMYIYYANYNSRLISLRDFDLFITITLYSQSGSMTGFYSRHSRLQQNRHIETILDNNKSRI